MITGSCDAGKGYTHLQRETFDQPIAEVLCQLFDRAVPAHSPSRFRPRNPTALRSPRVRACCSLRRGIQKKCGSSWISEQHVMIIGRGADACTGGQRERELPLPSWQGPQCSHLIGSIAASLAGKENSAPSWHLIRRTLSVTEMSSTSDFVGQMKSSLSSLHSTCRKQSG